MFSLAGALQVTIPQPEYEHARGDNITLPCNFVPKNPKNPLVIIIWTVDSPDPAQPEVTTRGLTKQVDFPPPNIFSGLEGDVYSMILVVYSIHPTILYCSEDCLLIRRSF